MEERSVTIYKLFIDANNKFDQFILAMLVTLLTYLMTTIQLAPIGLNSSTVALVSLIFIGLAVIFGFKRIESNITLQRLNHEALHYSEIENRDRAKTFKSSMPGRAALAKSFYHLRNTFILLGLTAYISSKILAAYQI